MNELVAMAGFPGEISLKHYEPVVKDWPEYCGLAAMLEAIKQGHQWWIGDLALYGEKVYPSQFSQAWLAEQLDLSEASISTYMNVCRAFPVEDRFAPPICFEHHLAAMALPGHLARRKALEIALAKRKSVRTLRAEIKAGKMLERQNTTPPPRIPVQVQTISNLQAPEENPGSNGSLDLTATLSSAHEEADAKEALTDYQEYTQTVIEMQIGVPDTVAQDALDALAALIPTLRDKEIREPLSRLMEAFLGHGFSVKRNFPPSLYIYKKRERFISPSLLEVEEYATSKGKSKGYASTFWHRYESQGWKIGHVLIENWKAKFDEWTVKDQPKEKEYTTPAITEEEMARYAR